MTRQTDPYDLLIAARPTAGDLNRHFEPAGERILDQVRAGRSGSGARPERRAPRRGRRWLATGLVAAAAAGALAILPSIISPDASPQASALSALASTAATQHDGPIPAGHYVHLTTTQTQSGGAVVPPPGASTTGTQPSGPDEVRTRQQWVGADGTTYAKLSGPDVNAVFRFPATAPYDPATVLMLPTQAEPLLAWFQDHTNGSSSAHEAVFVGVGDLLRTGFVSADVAKAAIESLGRLPEVTTEPTTTPAGRPGVRVTFRDTTIRSGTHYYIFEQATADLVEEGTDDGEGHTYRAVTAYGGLVSAVPAAILDAAVDPAEPPATTSPKTQPTG